MIVMASVLCSAHHPAALRNRQPILEALRKYGVGQAPGLALEIGSGTGAHVEVFAPAFPSLVWQPTEYVPHGEVAQGGPARGELGARGPAGATFDEAPRALEAIDLVGARQFPNVLPAVALDAALDFERWPPQTVAAEGNHRLVVCINVCHISPWAVTCGLIAGAGRALAPAGSLVIYGPFKVGGTCTTESNAAFDQSLRQRDREWGIRDVEALVERAGMHGMALQTRAEMPANNFLLRFVKGS